MRCPRHRCRRNPGPPDRRRTGTAGPDVVAATTREGAPSSWRRSVTFESISRTGEGLEDATEGIDTIIHSATSPPRAREVDLGGLVRLIAVAPEAHVIYPGIVGCDLIPTPYYRVKTETEEALVGSGRRGPILRATQFHQLIWHWYATTSRNPFLLVPSHTRYQVWTPRSRPASGRPGGGRPPGPGRRHRRPHRLRSGRPRPLVPVRPAPKRRIIRYTKPGMVGAALRAGANLTPTGPAAKPGTNS